MISPTVSILTEKQPPYNEKNRSRTACRQKHVRLLLPKMQLTKLPLSLYNIGRRKNVRDATVAQSVEQLIRNQQVRGSSPLGSFLKVARKPL